MSNWRLRGVKLRGASFGFLAASRCQAWFFVFDRPHWKAPTNWMAASPCQAWFFVFDRPHWKAPTNWMSEGSTCRSRLSPVLGTPYSTPGSAIAIPGGNPTGSGDTTLNSGLCDRNSWGNPYRFWGHHTQLRALRSQFLGEPLKSREARSGRIKAPSVGQHVFSPPASVALPPRTMLTESVATSWRRFLGTCLSVPGPSSQWRQYRQVGGQMPLDGQGRYRHRGLRAPKSGCLTARGASSHGA